MSAIIRYIDKVAEQTVVYWGNPQHDGEGGFIYDDPVEIKCRWIDNIQKITTTPNYDANILISRAVIYTNEVLEVDGMVFLGTLESIEIYQESSGDTAIHPKLVPNTFAIKRIGKIPEIKGDQVLRLYYISPYIG